MTKEELKKYMENPNVKWVLYKILKHESGRVDGKINSGSFNESAGNSSAYGSQQFIGSTRNMILEEYGIDAWSDNLQEQMLASVALMAKGNDLENVAKGNYSGLNREFYWEAFTKDFTRITEKKPSDWEEKYNTLVSDSIHDPSSSWAKIDPEVKKKKQNLFENKYGGMPEGFDKSITVPTEEEASKDPRYARKESPRLNEAKDFIKQWKEIQNSERVDKDKALRDLAETHPGFKYTIPNYVKGKASGHTGGLFPKFFTEGYTEKNQRLLKYNSINDINRFINDSENAILKQADAADQISIGVKPSLVLKDVSDNIVVAKDEKNNIPATKKNLSPTPVISEDNKVESFVELPEVIDTDLVEEAEKEPTTFMGPDGKFYPYQTVEPGQEDKIASEGLLNQNQGNELTEQESEENIIVDPNTGKKYFDLRGDSGDLSESFLDKMGGVSSLIGLATGAIGLGAALKNVDIPKDPKLGPAFQQRLAESKRMAQQGLTPSELAKAHNDLDSAYATGIDNIVRGSAGNRA